MEEYSRFPVEITEKESQLGFIRAYVNNPDFEYMGHASFVIAVVRQLDKANRVIKLSNPSGDVEYSHQVFGRYGSSGRPDWMPILMPYPTPEMAINAIRSGAYQTDPLAQTVHAAPDEVAINLRCPSCSNEFSVNEDYLEIEGPQVCPSCEHEAQVEEFKSYNL